MQRRAPYWALALSVLVHAIAMWEWWPRLEPLQIPAQDTTDTDVPLVARIERGSESRPPAPPPAAVKAEPAKGSTGIGWFLLLAALVFGGIFAKLAFTTDATPAGNYVDPPAGVELRADEGVLQIDGAGDAEVLVDGSPRGRGPNVRVTLPMGPREAGPERDEDARHAAEGLLQPHVQPALAGRDHAREERRDAGEGEGRPQRDEGDGDGQHPQVLRQRHPGDA